MTKKILIVEDNELNAKLINQYLKQKGYITKHIDSGDEALDATIEFTPDLILMDIEINGINGVQACAQIRKNKDFSNIPIVAVTSFSREKVLNEMNGRQFNEYVQKPIVFSEFNLILEKYASLL